MKTAFIIFRNIILALAVALLAGGCSGSNTTKAAGGTGSVSARLQWVAAKASSKTVSLVPAGVTTVRIIITGPGMTTMQQDFPAAGGTGTIGAVPVGSGITVTAQGLDGSNSVTHQGSVNNVTVLAGQTTDVGTIAMQAVAPQPAGVIQLPRTGQTTSYATGDDGDLQKGVAWPIPRFTDNNNGTVTDNLTGLIWLKNANCFGAQAWTTALTSANTLASGSCGLTDGSTAGQWRLPNRKELQSLVDRSQYNPALPLDHPFSAVLDNYWSSSTVAYGGAAEAWYVGLNYGYVDNFNKNYGRYVWPVRGRQ